MIPVTKLLFGLACLVASGSAANTILCYYESWSQWQGDGKFLPSDIPAHKCTHLVYSFILPWPGGFIKDFQDANTLNEMVALKKQNPNLKVTAAIGGWSAGSTDFSNIVGEQGARGNLVRALGDFVDQYHLDGIDIDWEYPAQRGGAAADKENYITFLRDLRNRLGWNRVITAAVGAGTGFIGSSYDVRGMNQYLTYINLMTYDFHSADDRKTGQNSPLYASNADGDHSLNADATVSAWINAGASPGKLLMGLGFYGHTFKLSNPGQNGMGAQVYAAGDAGPYTQEAGYKSYLEICRDLKQGGFTTVYDGQTQSPYSHRGNDWYGYDNVQSIKAKSQYAVNRGLAGVMMWAIDQDDLHNVCGGGSLPLLNAINSVIHI